MAKKKTINERDLYFALRYTFNGSVQTLHNSKEIRNHIVRHQHLEELHDLVQRFSLEKVVDATKILLDEHVFQSPQNAKRRFSELLTVSEVQNARRKALEAEASKKKLHTVRHAVEGGQSSKNPLAPDVNSSKSNGDTKGKERAHETSHEPTTINAPVEQTIKPALALHSLYPVCLPFITQHKILVHIQGILEKSCFAFARIYLEDVVKEEDWDCSECVELSSWSKIFLQHKAIFNESSINELGQPMTEFLETIDNLRHTAVHRNRVNASKVEQFVVAAEKLLALIGDETALDIMIEFRRDIQRAIEELERKKERLEAQLADKMKQIAEQREELNRQELEAGEEMVKMDKEHQRVICDMLEDRLLPPTTAFHSASASVDEPASDNEAEASGSSFEGAWVDENDVFDGVSLL